MNFFSSETGEKGAGISSSYSSLDEIEYQDYWFALTSDKLCLLLSCESFRFSLFYLALCCWLLFFTITRCTQLSRCSNLLALCSFISSQNLLSSFYTSLMSFSSTVFLWMELYLQVFAVSFIHVIIYILFNQLSQLYSYGGIMQGFIPRLFQGSRLWRWLSIFWMRELNFLRYKFFEPELELYFWRSLIVVKGRVNVVSWRFILAVIDFRGIADGSRPNTELYAYFLVSLLYFCTKQVVPFKKLSFSYDLLTFIPSLVKNFLLKSSFLSLNSKFYLILLGFSFPDLMLLSSFSSSLDLV